MKALISFLLIGFILLSSCKILEDRDIERRRALKYSDAVRLKYNNSERPEHLLITNGNLTIQDEEKSNSLRITFYSKKDDFIFLSGRFLGFEVFRFMMTEDSIKFINRANRNYFFGSRQNVKNEFLQDLKLSDLQNLIFTGFIELESPTRRTVERDFEPEVNKISYSRIIDKGIKIEMEYDLAAFLERLLISSHVNSVYVDMLIEREKLQVKTIRGSYYRNNYQLKYEFEPNGISNKAYDRIKFNVSNNYNEVRNIF